MSKITDKDIKALQADPEALKKLLAENEDLKSKSTTQEDMIKDLNAELEEAAAAPVAKKLPQLSIEKEKYQCTLHKFRVPGHQSRVFTIEDLKKDEDKVQVKVRTKEGIQLKELSLREYAVQKGVLVKSNA